MPVPFFSRGFNLAKAAVMLPLSPIAPLVFFLIRRDRLVCSWCKNILPGEASLSLLDSFSSSPTGLMGSGGQTDALTRASDAVHHEIAVHEHKSRRSRRRATTLGLATIVMTAVGGTAALEEGAEEATFFFSMGGLSGVGAFASSRRGKRHQLAAEAKRQKFRVLEVLNLARAQGGRLTVTAVAAQMRLDLREAEALLDSMVDGRRVDVHVDEGGRLTYVFTELAT
ncbi:MAG TPA: hypothetical protein VGF45_24735 [Polyangia bacterium]